MIKDSIHFTTVKGADDIRQILTLQKANLPESISNEMAASQGFVTVQHDFDLLTKMNEAIPQVIAIDDRQVVGYALTMLPSFQKLIPVLKSMFAMFRRIEFGGRKIADYNYYVMGQICVAQGYRGQGIFDGLYLKHKTLFADKFDFCITEIATRNTRSLRAHKRVGFETIHTFQDETDLWEIVIWDWR